MAFVPSRPPRQSGLGAPIGHAIHTVQRRDSKRLFTRLLLIGLILLLIGAVGAASWFSYSINAAVTSSANETIQIVIIPPKSSVHEIATLLANKGLLRDQTAFEIYARIGPAHGLLKPGPYQLKTSMSTIQILDYLSSGKIAVRTFVARDGSTLAQLATSFEQQGFGMASDFTAAVQSAHLSPVAQPVFGNPTSLEGLLPGDSYQLVINDTAPTLIARMLDNLDANIVPLFQATPTHPNKLSAYQILTLASIVEKEASTPADQAGVAGVFLNRLRKGIKLESDVTVIYLTGRIEPTAADLALNSPYNTRKFAGLPPTPISVPSVAAIQATLNPTESNYLFFIGGSDGKVYYATTYAEHQANIDKHLK